MKIFYRRLNCFVLQNKPTYLPAISNKLFSSVSAEHIAHFRNEGFVAIDNFFSDEEIEAIRLGLLQLKIDGRLAIVSTEDDGKTHTHIPKNLQLCPLSSELPIFKSLPFHSRIGSAVHSLLYDLNHSSVTEQDICCYLSQTFWKPGKHGLGTSWHQDNAYFALDSPQFGTAMWIPIDKATKENGTLRVMKGFANNHGSRHPSLLPHFREETSDHHITCKAYIADECLAENAIDIELDVGGVAFFNNNVPHCTGPNQTNQSRAAVAFHFLNMIHFKEKQFPLPEGCEYITPIVYGKNCTNGLAEYYSEIGHEQWLCDMNEILSRKNDILHKYSIHEDSSTFRSVQQDLNY